MPHSVVMPLIAVAWGNWKFIPKNPINFIEIGLYQLQ